MEMIQSIRAKWPTIRYKTLSWRIMQRDAELNDLIIVLFTLSLGTLICISTTFAVFQDF